MRAPGRQPVLHQPPIDCRGALTVDRTYRPTGESVELQANTGSRGVRAGRPANGRGHNLSPKRALGAADSELARGDCGISLDRAVVAARTNLRGRAGTPAKGVCLNGSQSRAGE